MQIAETLAPSIQALNLGAKELPIRNLEPETRGTRRANRWRAFQWHAKVHPRALAEGRASWPLSGRALAKAGPTSSESDAAVNNTSSSLKETASRASGLRI